MEYDRDGFRISPGFDAPRAEDDSFGPVGARSTRLDADARGSGVAGPRRGAGAAKRFVVGGAFLALILGAVVGPVVMPAVREAVIDWSLAEAEVAESRGDVAGALGHVERAVHWGSEHAGLPALLCVRGQLRLENGDARGALADADRAVAIAPAAPQPLRLRAIVNVVEGRPEQALADAKAVLALDVRGNPEALNLLAYTRALVRRELPEALGDIEQALARSGEESPEHLDTRGYVLHLLGRHAEAIDDLNRAIDGMQEARRRLASLVGRIDRVEIDRRLRINDHGLAVMYQHRGEACAAAGFAAQAEQDFEVARRKGYDPDRGIF